MTQSKLKCGKEQEQMALDLGLGKLIEANFDGGRISSDGGALLLRKADEWLDLTRTASFCLTDCRRQDLVKHSLLDMLRQRVYGIAHLYEDCNDAAFLRHDDMHKLALGKLPSGSALGSQPTLSRFENSVDETAIKALQQTFVHAYIRMQMKKLKRKPLRVVRLHMDTTCDETHGYQQMTFYNGFYETDCYVPLLIFTEDGFPMASLLRPGNAAPGDGALRMLKMVVHNLRLAWPQVQIEITADAAFALPELYNWCEDNNVTFYFAIKGNAGLNYHTDELVEQCKRLYDEGNPNPSGELIKGQLSRTEIYRNWRQTEERKRFSNKAEGRMQEQSEQEERVIRCFHSFQYDAREWRYKRRIVAKVQFSAQGSDVRYVVTNDTKTGSEALYSKYCERARCENWIKDLKNYLRADRTSCQEFNANQFRLFEHTFAYCLLWVIKGAAGLEHSTIESLRVQLLKVGVQVTENSRKVRLRLASIPRTVRQGLELASLYSLAPEPLTTRSPVWVQPPHWRHARGSAP